MQEHQDDRRGQLDLERISFFYESAGTGLLGLSMCVLFMAVVVRQFYSPTAAVVWAVAVVVAYMPRVILWVRFSAKIKRGEITTDNVKPWERGATLGSVVPYAIYASAAFFPYGDNVEGALMLFAVMAVLLVGGGSQMYSTSPGIVLIFFNFTFISIIVRSFWEGGFLLTTLGVVLTIGYLMLTRVVLRANSMMVDAIALRIDSAHRSFVDPLTRLWNRRRLDLFVEMLIPASRRNKQPFSIVLLDVDHFKRYNDSKGHQAGDDLLVEVAEIIQGCAREQDLVVRYGGEEFLVVLPTTSGDEARFLAERILRRVRESTEVTISAGVDESGDDRDFDQMVERADQALYAAKQSGRDAVRKAG